MAINQTYRKEIINGEELMILVSEEIIPEPEPEPEIKTLEQLQQEYINTIARAKQILDDIQNDNWIPF